MFFIEIASKKEAKSFTAWLSSTRKFFSDTQSFQEWLDNTNNFPLEFYLNGITYRIETKRECAFFQIGFEAALGLFKDE